AVFGYNDFARSISGGAGELRRQAFEQARKRVGTRVSRDYDRELQISFLLNSIRVHLQRQLRNHIANRRLGLRNISAPFAKIAQTTTRRASLVNFPDFL
ncbi:MAG: hypothetical protein WB999_11695, partial [Candidatus Binataceae bacterium]